MFASRRWLPLFLGLMALSPTAHAAHLDIFDFAAEAVEDLLPPPGIASVGTEGFGSRDATPMARVALSGKLRRGDVLKAALYQQGKTTTEIPLEEGRGLVFEGVVANPRWPLEGYAAADTVDGTRGTRPLCPLTENFRRDVGNETCYAGFSLSPALAELTGVRGGWFTGAAGGVATHAVHLRFSWTGTPPPGTVLSIFFTDGGGSDTALEDFTAWRSLHVHLDNGACFLADAAAQGFLASLKKDAARLDCTMTAKGITLRLSKRAFDTVPKNLLLVPLLHTGGFSRGTEVLDILPPTRLSLVPLRE